MARRKESDVEQQLDQTGQQIIVRLQEAERSTPDGHNHRVNIFTNWLLMTEQVIDLFQHQAKTRSVKERRSLTNEKKIGWLANILFGQDRFARTGTLGPYLEATQTLLATQILFSDMLDLLGSVYTTYAAPVAVQKLDEPLFVSQALAERVAAGHIKHPYTALMNRLKNTAETAAADDATLVKDMTDFFQQTIGLPLMQPLSEKLANIFFNNLLPQIKAHGYKPVLVHSLCCGTGMLLVAAAQRFPIWSIQGGLIKLIGFDINPVILMMARINLKLAGLDHVCYLRSGHTVTDEDLELIAEEEQAMYQSFRRAHLDRDEGGMIAVLLAGDLNRMAIVKTIEKTYG